MLAHAPGGDPGPPPRCLILVHGRCHAGPVAWGHAWVELPAGLVFDGVRQQFYDGAGYRHALGAVAEAAYGPAAAAAWLRATGHWGPWHRGPAEGCPDPARLDARPPAPAGWAGARAPPAGPARAVDPGRSVLRRGAGGRCRRPGGAPDGPPAGPLLGARHADAARLEGMDDRPTMGAPVACVIRVWGALDPRWSVRLGGLRITPAAEVGDAGEPITELRGALPDQAAVLEVLHTLHALGFALDSVTCTPVRRPAGGTDGPGAG